MRTRILLPILVVGVGLGSRASAAPQMANATLQTLPNGLRIIVREQHTSPLVAIDIWVRAGSGRERQDESGAAHFLEHLLFKGTATRKPGEIDAAIEDLGATLNATTMRDGMRIFTTVPSRDWKSALDVMADSVQNAALRPEDVERERSVILDEVARGRNNLLREAETRLYESLYAGHGYGRSVLGAPQSLRQISQATIQAFYRRLYAPGSTTVVVVGDVAPAAAVEAVRGAMGGWAARDVPPPDDPRGAPIAAGKGAAAGVDVEGAEYMVGVGCRVPGADSRLGAAVADVAAAILGDPRTGRVATAAVRTRLTGAVSGQYSMLRKTGLLAVYLTAPAARVAAARQVLVGELDRLARGELSQDEVNAAKTAVLGAFLYETEVYGGQARMLGYHDVARDYRDAMTFADDIGKVTAADVAAFADQYLADGARAVVVVSPVAAEERAAR